ncbi:MAG: four helix bundle protein [Candidatus Cloacimonetes bacterium]|nr:four helix bundle protein [Candidatus Cloacimonadota bacterium]
MKKNIIAEKSFDYALLIIKLYQYLVSEKREYVMSKQLLRAGTSVGANVREAGVAQSKKEFIAKMNISLKEIHECEYWLLLLNRAGYISREQALEQQTDEIKRILSSIIKTSNESMDKQSAADNPKKDL